MSPNDPDDVLLSLRRTLAPIDPPGPLGERVHRKAHAALRARPDGSWLTVATKAWTTVGLPAALAVTVVAYLSWAVTSASALYR
jgi:hypothetical protein